MNNSDKILIYGYGALTLSSISYLVYEHWDNLSCVKIRDDFFNWQTNYLTALWFPMTGVITSSILLYYTGEYFPNLVEPVTTNNVTRTLLDRPLDACQHQPSSDMSSLF